MLQPDRNMFEENNHQALSDYSLCVCTTLLVNNIIMHEFAFRLEEYQLTVKMMSNGEKTFQIRLKN